MEPDLIDEAGERAFWLAASESSLRKIWDNPEDDVYAQLLDRSADELRK